MRSWSSAACIVPRTWPSRRCLNESVDSQSSGTAFTWSAVTTRYRRVVSANSLAAAALPRPAKTPGQVRPFATPGLSAPGQTGGSREPRAGSQSVERKLFAELLDLALDGSQGAVVVWRRQGARDQT